MGLSIKNLFCRVVSISALTDLTSCVIKNIIELFGLERNLDKLWLKHNLIILPWSNTRMISSGFYPINSTSAALLYQRLINDNNTPRSFIIIGVICLIM